MTVAISPHYYYPTDHGWKFGGPLEKLMHAIGMFDRKGSLSDLTGFEGSGADFMPEYKEYIEDGKTIIASPAQGLRAGSQRPEPAASQGRHRARSSWPACRPTSASRPIMLRTAGTWATRWRWCAMPRQAAMLPEGDGYQAALINFRYVANALWSTDDAVQRIQKAGA